MLRILSECTASVRKSLQGSDYIAAEGAKSFDDLSLLINQTANTVDSGTALQETQSRETVPERRLQGKYTIMLVYFYIQCEIKRMH